MHLPLVGQLVVAALLFVLVTWGWLRLVHEDVSWEDVGEAAVAFGSVNLGVVALVVMLFWQGLGFALFILASLWLLAQLGTAYLSDVLSQGGERPAADETSRHFQANQQATQQTLNELRARFEAEMQAIRQQDNGKTPPDRKDYL
jgi:hypothetical protein